MNLVLLFDEIQVGLGRTDKTFCFEHESAVRGKTLKKRIETITEQSELVRDVRGKGLFIGSKSTTAMP